MITCRDRESERDRETETQIERQTDRERVTSLLQKPPKIEPYLLRQFRFFTKETAKVSGNKKETDSVEWEEGSFSGDCESEWREIEEAACCTE